MKETAVDWFSEKTFNQIELLKRGYVNQEEFLSGMLKLRDQAKEMEKEQMCDFVEYCQTEHSKYQETEASWIKELTIDDLFEKRYTK